jgi:hypothetical protein
MLLLYLQEDASLTKAWQKTVRVAVTGASGQIANHLLFMVSQLHSTCAPPVDFLPIAGYSLL